MSDFFEMVEQSNMVDYGKEVHDLLRIAEESVTNYVYSVVTYTPLRIADIAIGTCWGVQKDESDTNRMYRVANKNKHLSTVEHLRFSFIVDNDVIIKFFTLNKYTTTTTLPNISLITTNMRVILEAYHSKLISKEVLFKLLPDCYKFLIDNSEPIPDTSKTDKYLGDDDVKLLFINRPSELCSNNEHHISYNFKLTNWSRGLLQEQARHRAASLSVRSSRYTLKELKDEECFLLPGMSTLAEVKVWLVGAIDHPNYKRITRYIVMTDEPYVNAAAVLGLENLRILVSMGIANDKTKYAMVESYKTELIWTIDYVGLKNFLMLRTNKAALWEIRELAYRIYDMLPSEHKELYSDIIYKKE